MRLRSPPAACRRTVRASLRLATRAALLLLAPALLAAPPPAAAARSGLAARCPRRCGPPARGAAGARGPPAAPPHPREAGGQEGHRHPPPPGRRLAALGVVAAALGAGLGAGGARALVKGNAPPSGYGIGKNLSGAKAEKCSSRQECEEAGRAKEEKEFGQTADVPYSKTSSGARYRDLTPGSKADGVAAVGDVVRVRYKVMRSGKRSSDGLSGEASTIFSWGFGDEDSEPKGAVLAEKLGQGKFVKALDEGLVGMAVGGKRRVQVRPENGLGWRKVGKCAEADQALVDSGLLLGGVEDNGTCLDESKLPQPRDFGQKRRFSRRFDESLIVEVELVGLGPA